MSIIVGLDISKIHYGMVIRKFFPNKESITDYIFLNKSKIIVEKGEKKGYQCHSIKDFTWFKKQVADDNHAYGLYIANHIKNCIISDFKYMEQDKENIKYLAIEGYAYGGISGQLLQIAEVGGMIKQLFYDTNWKIRIHDPTSLKLWATGNGRAEKIEMRDAAIRAHLAIPEFLFEHEIAFDIADALFLMEMLSVELMVRESPSLLDKLPDNQKLIFNRVTQASPVNLLNRPFIEKDFLNAIQN